MGSESDGGFGGDFTVVEVGDLEIQRECVS